MQQDDPGRVPDNIHPASLVSRIRGPSGEELEAAELRVAPAEIEKLREVVTTRGGEVRPVAERDTGHSAGSIALLHPMDGSGMYLVDFRSPELGWILRVFTEFRDMQML